MTTQFRRGRNEGTAPEERALLGSSKIGEEDSDQLADEQTGNRARIRAVTVATVAPT